MAALAPACPPPGCRRRRAGPHLHQFAEDPRPAVQLIPGAALVAGGKLHRLAGLDAAGAFVGHTGAGVQVGIGRDYARCRKGRRLRGRRSACRQGGRQCGEAGKEKGEETEARSTVDLFPGRLGALVQNESQANGVVLSDCG